ncbi:MAG: 2,3-bisphosphoglycerate-independent phosphoglycerate mutase, partial [Candidatus Berkelbacteria bacterium]
SIAITSDHGNAEESINPKTNQPNTEHTTNPVPFVIISKEMEVARKKMISTGALCNIAPTILEIMGIPKPAEMTSNSLFERSNGQ